MEKLNRSSLIVTIKPRKMFGFVLLNQGAHFVFSLSQYDKLFVFPGKLQKFSRVIAWFVPTEISYKHEVKPQKYTCVINILKFLLILWYVLTYYVFIVEELSVSL